MKKKKFFEVKCTTRPGVCVTVNGVNVGLYAELQTRQQILLKFAYKLLNTCDNISIKMSSIH